MSQGLYHARVRCPSGAVRHMMVTEPCSTSDLTGRDERLETQPSIVHFRPTFEPFQFTSLCNAVAHAYRYVDDILRLHPSAKAAHDSITYAARLVQDLNKTSPDDFTFAECLKPATERSLPVWAVLTCDDNGDELELFHIEWMADAFYEDYVRNLWKTFDMEGPFPDDPFAAYNDITEKWSVMDTITQYEFNIPITDPSPNTSIYARVAFDRDASTLAENGDWEGAMKMGGVEFKVFASDEAYEAYCLGLADGHQVDDFVCQKVEAIPPKP